MKKEFMEPEMRRIELNLKEGIATGSGVGYGSIGSISTQQIGNGCTDLYIESGIEVGNSWVDSFVANYDAIVQGRCVPGYEAQRILNSL